MDIKSLTKDQLIERRKLLLRKQELLSQLSEDVGQSFIDKIIGGGVVGGGAYVASKIAKPIGKGVSYLQRGFRNVPIVQNTAKTTLLAEDINRSFHKVHTEKINEFGKDLDKWTVKYPNRAVDLSQFISELQTNPEVSKDAIRIFQKTPILQDLMLNPQSANNVPLKDAQEIINFINKKVPAQIRNNNFDILEGLNTIKGAQIEAFPEMGATREAYRKFIEPYKAVEPNFKFNRVISSITSEGAPFGGAQGWEAVKKLLPEKVINQIRDYRAGSRIERMPRKTPWLGRYLGGAPMVLPIIPKALNYILNPNEQPKGTIQQMYDWAGVDMNKPEDLII